MRTSSKKSHHGRWLLRLSLLALLILLATAVSADPLWMRYPAISPDGATIAFSYKGDLYSVPTSGGDASLLTLHEAYDFIPVWSPDGQSIAFASDRNGNYNIFLMSASGGPARRLTFHSAYDRPSDFTPDGKAVIFRSSRLDDINCVQFPSGAMSELYRVPVDGGRVEQMITTPAELAQFDRFGKRLAYQDCKGYEDYWRKHHTSAIARDLWLYDIDRGTHAKLTDFAGEDRNPVWSPNDDTLYFLSERDGSFNVWQMPVADPAQATQVTHHSKHPVRFLSMSDAGDICYGFDGEIYVRLAGETESRKVNIRITFDERTNETEFLTLSGNASDLAVSPNGKEVAFVIRGEVFVAAVDHGLTKRITNTPEQERSVSFSPDGRSLLYAGERNKSWNIYQSTIADDNEPYFYNCTLIEEKAIVKTDRETFQPSYSPDGKEVAFLEERTILKVINLASDKTRTIFPEGLNYSYIDGDQWYQWSPDGQWFLIEHNSVGERWSDEVALVDVEGEKEPINLTKSGYEDYSPQWMMGGKMMIWLTDRYGRRNHGGWGFDSDLLGMFFTQDAWDRYNLSEAELEILEKQEEEAEKNKDDNEAKEDDDGKEDDEAKEDDDDSIKLPDPVPIELTGIEGRTLRLTTHSSRLADAVLTSDGEQLLYLARFEEGYDLWSYKHRTSDIELLTKLNAKRISSFTIDSDDKNLFLIADGQPIKIELPSGKRESIGYSASMYLKPAGEREYMFEHVWRQMLKKFYVEDMHGVDWEFYKKEYARFLPHINNNWDFAEMLSEMLGELNGSHTGSGYVFKMDGADETGSLGAFFDPEYSGDGLKIVEIFEKSPLHHADTKIKVGTIIEKIDGEVIKAGQSYYPLLNHKAGKPVQLTLKDSGDQWSETIKPISRSSERELTYQRWVKTRREETERLSGGRLGYIHIRSMGPSSFRTTFAEMLGRHTAKEAIIVDTRFNGGGNLHDDLVTLLGGQRYWRIVPRGQKMGEEPWAKWNRPSVVLMSESNYSDAHMFPFAYRELGLGKLVGMPVPGTGTSVWWETLLDRSLYFGIPEIGRVDSKGEFLENQQLEPDYLVDNEPEIVAAGRDQMLEKAVEVLLEQLDQ